MNNKFFKIIVLCVCAMFLLSFTACKDDKASDDTPLISSDLSSIVDSADPDIDNNNDVSDTSSGVELEEDVFESDDTTTSASSDNTTSSDKDDKDNQSNNQSTDKTESNTSSNNGSGDKADDNSSETESESEIEKDDDGTVKLPVDWF